MGTHADSKETRIHDVLNKRRDRRRGAGSGGAERDAGSSRQKAHAEARATAGPPPPGEEQVEAGARSLLGTLVALGAMIRDPNYQFPAQFKLLLILGMLYVISPIDLVPELIFGPFGVVDDIGVIVLLMRMIYTEANRYVGRRTGDGGSD